MIEAHLRDNSSAVSSLATGMHSTLLNLIDLLQPSLLNVTDLVLASVVLSCNLMRVSMEKLESHEFCPTGNDEC
jgi:hypothetical protein